MNKSLYTYGKISNFCSYTDAMLERLRRSMGLSMDIDTLRFCKEHCKTTNQRDIGVAELRLADEVASTSTPNASNAALKELLCSNENIIQTFNDLITKYTKLGNKALLSLTSAARVSSEYMEMIGVPKPKLPAELCIREPQECDKREQMLSYAVCAVADRAPESLLAAVAARLYEQSFEIREEAFKEHFLPAINTALEALLTPIARGYDREAVSLILNYAFPKEADAKTLGDCLAAILGAYRVTCELCMPDTSITSFKETDEISLTAKALIKRKGSELPSVLTTKRANLYLLPFGVDSEMPNFENLRKSCDEYHALVRARKVRGARAVCGRLSDTVSKMSRNFCLIPAEGTSEILDKSFRGIVFECVADVSCAILLGSVEQIEKTLPENPQQNSEFYQF